MKLTMTAVVYYKMGDLSENIDCEQNDWIPFPWLPV